MSAGGVETVSGSHIIARAKAIAAEDRQFTSAEVQEMRDAMFRLREAAQEVDLATLRAVVDQAERKASARMMEAVAKKESDAREVRRQYELKRPQRWAALSPLQRALRTVADMPGTPQDTGRILLMIASLVDNDERTKKTVAPSFESEDYSHLEFSR